MKNIIAQHRYENNKAIIVGICNKIKGIPKVDNLFLQIEDKELVHIFYLRPDEIILIIKLLSELILKRVVNYEVNIGKKTKEDY